MRRMKLEVDGSAETRVITARRRPNPSRREHLPRQQALRPREAQAPSRRRVAASMGSRPASIPDREIGGPSRRVIVAQKLDRLTPTQRAPRGRHPKPGSGARETTLLRRLRSRFTALVDRSYSTTRERTVRRIEAPRLRLPTLQEALADFHIVTDVVRCRSQAPQSPSNEPSCGRAREHRSRRHCGGGAPVFSGRTTSASNVTMLANRLSERYSRRRDVAVSAIWQGTSSVDVTTLAKICTPHRRL